VLEFPLQNRGTSVSTDENVGVIIWSLFYLANVCHFLPLLHGACGGGGGNAATACCAISGWRDVTKGIGQINQCYCFSR
jgi:hypothetical protein